MDRGTMMFIAIIAVMGIVIAGLTRLGTDAWMGEMIELKDEWADPNADPEEQMARLENLQKQLADAEAKALEEEQRRAEAAAAGPSIVPWVLLFGVMGGVLVMGPIAIRKLNEGGPPRQPRVVEEPGDRGPQIPPPPQAPE